MNKKITQIPIEGGSGKVPTGAMQFEDDWPGLFLRGDDAISIMGEIEGILEALQKNKNLKKEFYESDASIYHLKEIAEIIRKDVKTT